MTPLIAGLALLVAAPATKDPPKKEPPSLIGVWNIESAVKGGKADAADAEGSIEFTKDGNAILKERGKAINATYKIDAKKNPAELDLTLSERGMSITMNGIYKFDGESLIICLTFMGERPTKFESPEKAMTVLLTLKRPKKD